MQTHFPRPLLTLVAVAALLLPTAGATWYSFGTYEPDNALDNPAYMWEDPPLPGESRVYFNVYTALSGGVRGLQVSPNVGLLETSNEIPAMESHMAILGVWIDCNGDGYVGLAETAAREYPADLLLDDTICPDVIGDVDTWVPGAHSYNGWVSEYVPIAGQHAAITEDSDTRLYDDVEAMIWGDQGRPTDDASVSGSCPIAPQPRGTYQSTGGALNYIDCHADELQLGVMETFNTPFNGRRILAQDVPGAGDPLGLAFADDDNARGSMYDMATFGTEDSQYTALYVVDCSDEPTVNLGDTINGTIGDQGLYALDDEFIGTGIWSVEMREPDPTVGSDTPTIPATLNETNEELVDDCNTSNDAGHDFYGAKIYVGETDFNAISEANKREADYNFEFQEWGRGTDPLGIGFSAGAPTYDGYAGASVSWPYSNWNPGLVNVKGDPNRIVRTDLAEATVGIPDGLHFTFYAHVGSATASHDLPGGAGASGEYGAAQCQGAETGIHSGWNCDTTTWYLNPDGTPVPETTPLARPGQSYELRDVDCADNRNNLGVPTSTPGYGDGACERP